jgi:hypothetical protein
VLPTQIPGEAERLAVAWADALPDAIDELDRQAAERPGT